MTPNCAPHTWIETPEGVATLGETLRGETFIGLDTESDSMHSYFEKVCIMQVALPGDRFFVLDTLKVRDLSPLAPALADARIRKVLHGADYDIVCLKRDFRLELRGSFDTMTAAMMLGVERFGLADLVRVEFGVTLEKAFTRSDWSTRPLSAGQRAYLVEDVQFVIPLAQRLEARLQESGLVEEAAIEFRRLEERVPTPRDEDPWAFLRLRGVRDLPERGRAVLRELHRLREETARAMNRPTFKVLANETLLRIAQARPETTSALRSLKGVTPYILRRYGDDLVTAVRHGLEAPDALPDRPPPRPDDAVGARLGLSGQRRLGRLKDWRKAVVEKTKRTSIAVLPNHAMFEIARTPPPDLASLAAVPGVGEHRASLYGEDILRIAEPRPS